MLYRPRAGKTAMADANEDGIEVKSQIIMKVDAPPEDDASPPSGASINDTAKVSSFPSAKSKVSVLASPRLNSNPFSAKPSSILRPSQLGSKVDNKPDAVRNQFALNPSRLNVFARLPDSALENENDKTKSRLETPKFVPLAVTEAKTSTTTTNAVTSTPNFIFGHNLHERVISEPENSENTTEPVASTSCTNGTSDFLFRLAAQTVSTEGTKEVKTLTESAREYEESRANKRKYEEVTVVTGEEDEKNILQLNCKLFAFDKAVGSWQERGRGTLRLNDKELCSHDGSSYKQSRLVIRTSGSFRVVLNTKIWAEMTLDRASPKSLRLTAMDSSGQIKVFLIMANPDEVNHLHRLLEVRVKVEVERQKHLTHHSNSEPELKKPAVENCDQ